MQTISQLGLPVFHNTELQVYVRKLTLPNILPVFAYLFKYDSMFIFEMTTGKVIGLAFVFREG